MDWDSGENRPTPFNASHLWPIYLEHASFLQRLRRGNLGGYIYMLEVLFKEAK